MAAAAERLVINTGPVVALARIGELGLASRLGLDLVCPSEVRAELDAGVAAGHPAADWKGRRAAKAVGLAVTGSLGLLLRARTLGLIPAVRPLIERAIAAGVGYDAELIRRVLASVGE